VYMLEPILHLLLGASVRRWHTLMVNKCAHFCDNAVTWAAAYDSGVSGLASGQHCHRRHAAAWARYLAARAAHARRLTAGQSFKSPLASRSYREASAPTASGTGCWIALHMLWIP
jgi:hypothetical protein